MSRSAGIIQVASGIGEVIDEAGYCWPGMFPIRSLWAKAWKVTALSAFALIASCGGSEIEDYFEASDPVFDRHSATMATAESSMFEVSRATDTGGLSFGADIETARRLLPVFRETAETVERDIAAWDEIAFPESAREYHSLSRLVMSLRLQAMVEGEEALEQIVSGQVLQDAFLGPENAMADANAVLVRAVDEAASLRN